MTAAPLTLSRPRPPKALISLVAMIDVLLILLVFFMVTSTYLDLDMIPAVSQDDPTTAAQTNDAAPALPLLIRLAADGQPVVRGQPLSLDALDAMIRERLDADAQTPVIILPTGTSRTQALVTLMDRATRAGATEVRVIRLEARP